MPRSMFGSYVFTQMVIADTKNDSGIYCLLIVATLLNILTPELLEGVPEFIASCQTYEGGFGSASFPEWAFFGTYLAVIR